MSLTLVLLVSPPLLHTSAMMSQIKCWVTGTVNTPMSVPPSLSPVMDGLVVWLWGTQEVINELELPATTPGNHAFLHPETLVPSGAYVREVTCHQ